MKLIGSKLEKGIEESLVKSKGWVFSSDIYPAIQSKYGVVNSAYVLQWIPDQEHDLYCILIDGLFILSFEVPRSEAHSTASVDMEEISIQDWRKNTRKGGRLQLDIALKLAAMDKKNLPVRNF